MLGSVWGAEMREFRVRCTATLDKSTEQYEILLLSRRLLQSKSNKLKHVWRRGTQWQKPWFSWVFSNENIIKYFIKNIVFFSASEYLSDNSESERWILIAMITIVFTLLTVCTVATLIYRVYQNNILARLGKPLSYMEHLESSALRTGTYTVDHLKLVNLVGENKPSFFLSFSFCVSSLIIILQLHKLLLNFSFFFCRTRKVWLGLARKHWRSWHCR